MDNQNKCRAKGGQCNCSNADAITCPDQHERATEAKPSASAAPGMDLPQPALTQHGLVNDIDLFTADQMRAAIAAAREEAFEAGRLYEQEIVTQEAEEAADRAEEEAVRRARLAAPEGEAVAWIRKTDITEWTDTEPETDGWTPLYIAQQPQAKAPQQPPAGEDVLYGFNHNDLRDVAAELEQQPQTVSIGNITGLGEELLLTAPGVAVKFIRAALDHAPK